MKRRRLEECVSCSCNLEGNDDFNKQKESVRGYDCYAAACSTIDKAACNEKDDRIINVAAASCYTPAIAAAVKHSAASVVAA